jgi:hypothetical protein
MEPGVWRRQDDHGPAGSVQLTDKYEAVRRERTAALCRIKELDRELDYSLRLLAPDR